MNTPVYAEKITSLSDARYYSGMGVRWLGICVNPADPAYLSPQKFKEIAGWVSGPQFVIEAEGLPDTFEAAALKADYGISVFRVRDHQINSVNGFPFGLDLRKSSSPFTTEADYVILKSASELDKSANTKKLIPAPLSTSEAESILIQYPGTGFIITGSEEATVGLKEYDARDFLEFLDNRE